MTAPSMNRAQGDTAVLLQASQATDAVAERMRQHASTLQSRLVPMEQALVGRTGTAFSTFQTDYMSSFNGLYSKLKELAVQIRRTAQARESADAASNQRLNNAAGGQSAPTGGLSATLNQA